LPKGIHGLAIIDVVLQLLSLIRGRAGFHPFVGVPQLAEGLCGSIHDILRQDYPRFGVTADECLPSLPQVDALLVVSAFEQEASKSLLEAPGLYVEGDATVAALLERGPPRFLTTLVSLCPHGEQLGEHSRCQRTYNPDDGDDKCESTVAHYDSASTM
jgi:hypothetical protein